MNSLCVDCVDVSLVHEISDVGFANVSVFHFMVRRSFHASIMLWFRRQGLS